MYPTTLRNMRRLSHLLIENYETWRPDHEELVAEGLAVSQVRDGQRVAHRTALTRTVWNRWATEREMAGLPHRLIAFAMVPTPVRVTNKIEAGLMGEHQHGYHGLPSERTMDCPACFHAHRLPGWLLHQHTEGLHKDVWTAECPTCQEEAALPGEPPGAPWSGGTGVVSG